MPATANQTCVHHWVLGHPEDDVVRGRCKRCGETREYPASVDGLARPAAEEDAPGRGTAGVMAPEGLAAARLPGAAA
jgi:hypothetical protein